MIIDSRETYDCPMNVKYSEEVVKVSSGFCMNCSNRSYINYPTNSFFVECKEKKDAKVLPPPPSIREVREYASNNNISIKEALNILIASKVI